MAKFKVEIEEVLTKVIEVEAETAEQAEDKVAQAYKDEEIMIFPDSDWNSTKYRVLGEDEDYQADQILK